MLRRAPPWLSRGRGGSPRPTFLELHHSGRRETRVRGTRLGSRGLGLARLVHHAHGEARSVNWTRAPAASVPRQLDRHNPGRARPKAPATPSSGALESHDEEAPCGRGRGCARRGRPRRPRAQRTPGAAIGKKHVAATPVGGGGAKGGGVTSGAAKRENGREGARPNRRQGLLRRPQ
ncbi:unnamed protein product [Prorocentrum cordatum]|uniref:Uncharacterized protein n=1 Tax=Prorocentrum cordatum TaxID=2364126 RepID=A0ABN9XGR1_9DINO|nr:unnamed protein product [Polarella glacialis]